MNKKLLDKDWIYVGLFGVDAGLCWIGDPCYIIKDDNEARPKEFGKDWRDFCDILFEKEAGSQKPGVEFNYDAGHKGLGVCITSGYGDGTYGVYVKRNKDGAIAQALIDFELYEDGKTVVDEEGEPC